MTTQEINTANALSTAKEIVSQMIAQGLGTPRQIFAVCNVLKVNYNLTQDEAIIIVEEAVKIA